MKEQHRPGMKERTRRMTVSEQRTDDGGETQTGMLRKLGDEKLELLKV